jgi:hypothetical protein
VPAGPDSGVDSDTAGCCRVPAPADSTTWNDANSLRAATSVALPLPCGVSVGRTVATGPTTVTAGSPAAWALTATMPDSASVVAATVAMDHSGRFKGAPLLG